MNALFKPETFGLSENLTMVGEGPAVRRQRERANPAMRKAMLEAKALLESAWGGDRVAMIRVNEAITSSDLFKSAAGAFLDRELLNSYETLTPTWEAYAAPTRLKDFKPKTLMELAVPSGPLVRVPEHTNYPENKSSGTERAISIAKFGEQFGYTFEARINDDIGELAVVPSTWAARARQTEAVEALSVFANVTTGAPATALFNAGNKNIYTGVLDAANLQAAYTAVTSKVNANGTKLVAPQMQLVVGTALEFTARRIINTQEIRTTVGAVQTVESNPFAGIKLTVQSDLPGTSWFLMPIPKAGVKSPVYLGKLIGFETPDLRVKADQGSALGGGALSAEDGSFDDDTIYFRVRHITGAAQGDATFTMASDGAGTVLTKVGW